MGMRRPANDDQYYCLMERAVTERCNPDVKEVFMELMGGGKNKRRKNDVSITNIDTIHA